MTYMMKYYDVRRENKVNVQKGQLGNLIIRV